MSDKTASELGMEFGLTIKNVIDRKDAYIQSLQADNDRLVEAIGSAICELSAYYYNTKYQKAPLDILKQALAAHKERNDE